MYAKHEQVRRLVHAFLLHKGTTNAAYRSAKSLPKYTLSRCLQRAIRTFPIICSRQTESLIPSVWNIEYHSKPRQTCLANKVYPFPIFKAFWWLTFCYSLIFLAVLPKEKDLIIHRARSLNDKLKRTPFRASCRDSQVKQMGDHMPCHAHPFESVE